MNAHNPEAIEQRRIERLPCRLCGLPLGFAKAVQGRISGVWVHDACVDSALKLGDYERLDATL